MIFFWIFIFSKEVFCGNFIVNPVAIPLIGETNKTDIKTNELIKWDTNVTFLNDLYIFEVVIFI